MPRSDQTASISARGCLGSLESQYRHQYPKLRSIAELLSAGKRDLTREGVEEFKIRILTALDEGRLPREATWVRGLCVRGTDLVEILLAVGLFDIKETERARARAYRPGHDQITEATAFSVAAPYAVGLGLTSPA